jgi:hypothetical protein
MNPIDVQERINLYVDLVQKKNNRYYEIYDFKFSDPPTVTVDYGNKYARIVKNDQLNGSRTVHTFVNMTNGDILKSGGWKAPAPNGVRGNIFANDFGADRINEHGANYLKGPQF